MSTLVHLINFNDNDTTTVHDLSGNQRHSASIVGAITTPASDIGRKGVFAGAASIHFSDAAGEFNDIDGAAIFSVYGKINITSTLADQYISNKGGVFRIFWDQSAAALAFEVTTADGDFIASDAVSTGQWVRFCAEWNKATNTARIVVDSTLWSDGGSVATTGVLNSNANDVMIGASTADTSFFTGSIEEVRIYASNTTDAELLKLMNADNDSGILCTVPTSAPHSLLAGDMIIHQFGGSREVQGLVTTVDSTTTFRVLPFNANRPLGGETWVRCGNTYDADRQSFTFSKVNGEDAETIFLDDVDAFADLTAVANVVMKVNRDGVKFRTVSKSAAYTAVNNDRFIFADPSGGAFTITLPASPSTGQRHTIGDIDGSAFTNNITVNGNGKNINGNATNVINADEVFRTYMYHGTAWSIESSHVP